MNNSIRVLVAIANHGSGNREYLDKLIATYQEMPIDVSIVVLSNIKKDLGKDVEVRVGVPSSNPWSLPFAHRSLFRERIEEYDLFIYSEDDTLVSWTAIQAFMNSLSVLKDNEIAGFIRTEHDTNGNIFYSSCHSFFHWDPSSLRKRGKELWAKYTNEHAACFAISQKQLKRAISSGGFTETPHEGRHDMLCTAATDVYTQCGFERVVCIDQLSAFVLPHLPNKYIGKMGLPSEEMEWQIEVLRKIYLGEVAVGELIATETLLAGGVGSKFYREEEDSTIQQLLDKKSKEILVWGAGDGIFESSLQKLGHRVSVVPLNSVVGDSCRKRGLKVISEDDVNSIDIENYYDNIILVDIFHLVEKVDILLVSLYRQLKQDGSIIVRIPNLGNAQMLKRRLTDMRFKHSWSTESIGCTVLTSNMLKNLLINTKFNNVEIMGSDLEKRQLLNKLTLGLFAKFLSPYLYATAIKKT